MTTLGNAGVLRAPERLRERAKLRRIKIRVATPQESEEAQKLMFSMGYKWMGLGGREPSYLSIPYLFGDCDASITYSEYESTFLFEDKYAEVTLAQLREEATGDMSWMFEEPA
jgi:hypothetical protein